MTVSPVPVLSENVMAAAEAPLAAMFAVHVTVYAVSAVKAAVAGVSTSPVLAPSDTAAVAPLRSTPPFVVQPQLVDAACQIAVLAVNVTLPVVAGTVVVGVNVKLRLVGVACTRALLVVAPPQLWCLAPWKVAAAGSN